ncbi:hypothetical protein CRE_26055 [Caenorhabditis remanei]|uniref:Uncharacterized protein n=1 Tax=Caenorhabditis remanei TaxID=31234 RepID=E3LRG2_CAERE|nr:hypothetical protein CRE_26055 [Caenorhabditis remanei]
MDSFILVQAKGRTLKVRARRNGTITEKALRSAFLLKKEIPIGLSRNSIALECRSERDVLVFKLENQWEGAEFEMSWEEERQSRPITPLHLGILYFDKLLLTICISDNSAGYRSNNVRPESPYVLDEQLADDLRSRLFFIPRSQVALEKPGKSSIPRDGCINGGCVSPISSRAAVTYRHKSHLILREYEEGKDDDFNKNSIVEICNALNHSIRHKMMVIVVDNHHDFVILRSKDGNEIFKDFPHSTRSPKNFEWFLGYGLSHETDGGQHITHRSGRICSDSVDHRGRFLASSSIDGGDSGGPCYSSDRALIGIMVASTTTDPRLMDKDNREELEEEIIDASSSPADTWIAPGHLISEAYKIYQVNHGLLQVPRERTVGEPKPKTSKNSEEKCAQQASSSKEITHVDTSNLRQAAQRKPNSFLVYTGGDSVLYSDIRSRLTNLMPPDEITVFNVSIEALKKQRLAENSTICLLLASMKDLDGDAWENIYSYFNQKGRIIFVCQNKLHASICKAHASILRFAFGNQSNELKETNKELVKFLEKNMKKLPKSSAINETFRSKDVSVGANFTVVLKKEPDAPLFLYMQSNGSLHASVMFSDATTQQLIAPNSNLLRDSLRSVGVNVCDTTNCSRECSS